MMKRSFGQRAQDVVERTTFPDGTAVVSIRGDVHARALAAARGTLRRSAAANGPSRHDEPQAAAPAKTR